MFQRTDELNYRRTNRPLDRSLLDLLISVTAYAAKPLRSLRNVWYIRIASTAKHEQKGEEEEEQEEVDVEKD